jgi:hypothetical protein
MRVPQFYFIIVRLLAMVSLINDARLAAQAAVVPLRKS